MFVKNIDKLISATIRLWCGAAEDEIGVKVFDETNICQYYEGLKHDAIDEVRLALASLERFDIHHISDCIGLIKAIRVDILTNPEGESESLPPRAQQDWLSALAHLELAAIEMQRCDYHRMQNQ